MSINPVIFNSGKTDYEKTPILLGQPRGLLDSINVQYPDQTRLYEQLRGQDWTEKEFVFDICKIDFKTSDPIIANDMARTIAWQWETDSVASSTIAGIMSNVVTSSEVWTGYQRISDNESIHALTYAKIVKQCFDDPLAVMDRFKADMDAIERLVTVAKVFADAFEASHLWALYQFDPKKYPLTDFQRHDIFDKMFLYICALLIMERGQFMPSFAVTFGICRLQIFQVIGDAVQRIAQDEVEIHVPFGKYNIRDILQTDQGRDAFKRLRPIIVEMLKEAHRSEDHWVDVMHADGHELPGLPPSLLKKFNGFGFTDISCFLGVQNEMNFPLVYENPLPWMNDRVNLGNTQASPQEAPPTSYMVNALTRDDHGRTFDDFEL